MQKETVAQKIFDQVEELLHERNETQRAFLTETGIAASTYHGLKQGKSIHFEMLFKFCDYFSLTPNDFLGYSNKKEPMKKLIVEIDLKTLVIKKVKQ